MWVHILDPGTGMGQTNHRGNQAASMGQQVMKKVFCVSFNPWLAVVVALGLGACPPDDDDDDTGPRTCIGHEDCPEGYYCYLAECIDHEPVRDDASTPPDAAVEDGGGMDGSPPRDAGGRDAGPRDSGRLDAAPHADAAAGDGGAVDASPEDASVDAAQPPDAAVEEVDSGPSCHCTGMQTCNLEDFTCIEPTLCVADMDCLSPRVCVAGRCGARPECRGDAECDGGRCDVSRFACIPLDCTLDEHCPNSEVCIIELDADGGALPGVCYQCRDASDCPGAQVCEYQECREPPECTAKEDCSGLRECVSGVCTAPDCAALSATCPGDYCDVYEPNDTLTLAATLTSGTYHTTICGSGDFEWFKVPLAIGDGLVVRAASDDPTLGGLEMHLLDAMGSIIMGASRDGHGSTIAHDHANMTPLYVRTHGFNQPLLPVTMTLEIMPGGFCLADEAEPNETVTLATPVEASSIGNGEAYAFSVCPGDHDWFTGTLAPGLRLELTVSTNGGSAPIVELYSEDTSHMVLLDSTPDMVKTLVHDDIGTFLIHLHHAESGTQGKGVIVLKQSSPPPP